MLIKKPNITMYLIKRLLKDINAYFLYWLLSNIKEKNNQKIEEITSAKVEILEIKKITKKQIKKNKKLSK